MESENRPISAPAALQKDDDNEMFHTAVQDGPVRPFSAERVAEMDDPSDSEPTDACTGLEIMTQEAIALFKEGRHEEALTMAVQFSLAARNELGHTSPIHINALATVAALVDQMGGSAEADALLLEAEDLQDEQEMEALGIDLYAEDDDEDVEEMGTDEPSTRPPTALSEGSGQRASHDRGQQSRGSQQRSSTATGESVATDEIERYTDNEDWYGLNSAGGESESDADGGDSEPCSSDSRQRHLDDDEDGGEAEAEAITRLTIEVNTLLKSDCPEEAAKLLSEAESILVAGDAEISELATAALHTLWASVLTAVGEDEKAQRLYAEAINVLSDVTGAGIEWNSGSTSGGESGVESGPEVSGHDDEDEESEESEEETSLSESSASESQEDDKVGDASPAEELAIESPPQLFTTEPEQEPWKPTGRFTAADILLAKERAAKIREGMKAPSEREQRTSAEEAKTQPPNSVQLPPLNSPDVALAKDPVQLPPLTSPDVALAKKAEAADTPEVLCTGAPATEPASKEGYPPQTCTEDEVRVTTPLSPTPPPGASPTKRRRPPPLAPQPVAKAVAKPAARTGGGFTALPKPKAKTKAKAKAKVKAEVNAEVEVKVEEAAVEVDEEVATPPAAQEPPVEPEPATPPAAPEEPLAPLTAEQQKEAVERAMTCADHFLGLMHFGRAADQLEEQLVTLEETDNPHHHSELHIDVMTKYGSVLWLDKDPEGAVDAYTAAEEMLIAKPASNWQSKRRTEIWMQAAQICRGCGDLDSAEEQLSHSVFFLTGLAKSEPSNTEYRDALKEAKAALAQVCVAQKKWERAEELYMEAFEGEAVEDEDAATSDSEEPADSCKHEDGTAETPAEIGRPAAV